jgi:hypothetical protein
MNEYERYPEDMQKKILALSKQIAQGVDERFPRLIKDQCTIAEAIADITDPLLYEALKQVLVSKELQFLLTALHEVNMLTDYQYEELREQVDVLTSARTELQRYQTTLSGRNRADLSLN